MDYGFLIILVFGAGNNFYINIYKYLCILKFLYFRMLVGHNLDYTAPLHNWPNISPFHAIPDDFYRFTHHGAEYIFKQAGFKVEYGRRLGNELT